MQPASGIQSCVLTPFLDRLPGGQGRAICYLTVRQWDRPTQVQASSSAANQKGENAPLGKENGTNWVEMKKRHKSTMFTKSFPCGWRCPLLTRLLRQEGGTPTWGAHPYFTRCLSVWQLYCHDFRWLSLCSRAYKRSAHLSLVVQVEGDRVGEQSFLFIITPINLTHESSPVLSHQQHQLAAFDKVLPSLQEQHGHKRNFSAADLAEAVCSSFTGSHTQLEAKTNQNQKTRMTGANLNKCDLKIFW